jgi:hypothetical protein
MNGRNFLAILLTLLLVAAVIGAGTYVYNAGVTQGLAQSGKLSGPDGTVAPYVYGPYPHFGFWPFGLIGGLFFLFLLFGLLRLIFWRGQRGWGWRGDPERWKDHVPPMIEEWHRKMHESQSAPK